MNSIYVSIVIWTKIDDFYDIINMSMRLKSNGYGSFYQKIVLRVDANVADQAQNDLGADRLNESDTHVDLLWTRKSRKLGSDEDIVFEAYYFMNIEHGTWKILWDRSEY